MIATNHAAYCRLCWAAPELVLTCTASRAFQDRNVTSTLFGPEPSSHERNHWGPRLARPGPPDEDRRPRSGAASHVKWS